MIRRYHDVSSVREALSTAPRPLALVPTMGALHEGHLALLRAAREKVGPRGTVAISIFVNPIQFDRPEDLLNYPKTLENDLAACEAEGVDLAFIPNAGELYLPDRSVLVTESLLTKHLCGATRPGHFDGVLTVVLKLFNILQPDCAIFGKKDFQQLALINRMVRDLDVPVEIVGHPTIRQDDGLALSSRNRKLIPDHHADAPRIQRALAAARDLVQTGEQSPDIYLAAVKSHLLKDAPADFSIDYLEFVDSATLQPIAKLTAPATLATACFYGPVRLIDHIEIVPIVS
ncbi:MAG: pantoate--beta-alanine ligase [Verrucomicrobiaceae bacterium TMED86]|nr:MAG: pantoate--beta-alanine ligase [Verrucomicrobiaceae bacterium TMED86]